MSGKKKNLSDFDQGSDINASDVRVGVVVAEWNHDITSALLHGVVDTMKSFGVIDENIHVHYVPGSFELPMGAKLITASLQVDVVICLGCVIQGETRHFEFISNAVANGITQVGLDTNIPVVFGVLTTDNYQQAKDRAGGKHGNKGDEAGATAVKMAELKRKLHSRSK